MQREREESVLPATSNPGIQNIGRDAGHWEDTFLDLSPVEMVDGLAFKREDKYAPLGEGSINGSKLRQLIWLVHQYKQGGGSQGLISGASTTSPQLSMGSTVANHFGLPSTHVIGLNQFRNVKVAKAKPEVEMAALMGADFIIHASARNNIIQSLVRDLLKQPEYQGYFYLEYGVSIDHWQHPAREIEAFHRVGAEQVQNIPECENLIIPAGSFNSLVSILYGLAIYRPKVRNIILVEIGPGKRKWVRDRVLAIQSRNARHSPAKVLDGSLYPVEYHDLHGAGYVKYEQQMAYQHGSIEFHPHYEGKMMTYLADRRPDLLNENNVIWIIAGEGKKEAFMKAIE